MRVGHAGKSRTVGSMAEGIDVAQLSRKDLNLLVVFATVAEVRSVTAAAQKLNLSQSALSHAIGRLRIMFEDPLFVRGRNGFALTDRAEQLVGPVRAMLASLEGMLKPDSFDPARASRSFRIGFCETTMIHFGAAALRRAAESAPNVRVQLEIVDQHSERRLLESGLDMAICPHIDPPSPLRATSLFSDRFVSVLHRAHPLADKAREGTVSIDDYLAFPHVQTMPYGATSDAVDAALEELGLKRQIGVSATTYAPSFPLLFDSRLIATLPAAGAMAGVHVCRDLLMFEIPVTVPPVQYRVVWHRRNDRDPAMVWMRGLLSEVAGAGS